MGTCGQGLKCPKVVKGGGGNGALLECGAGSLAHWQKEDSVFSSSGRFSPG